MAVVNGYCTVAQLRAEMSDSGDQLPDALLEKAINASSRAIDQWTGRRFWQDPAPVTRVFVPDGYDMTNLPDFATTDGLVVATDADGDGTYETTWTINTDFLVGPFNADADGGAYAWSQLLAVGSKRFPSARFRRPSLQVTVPWGWSATPDQVNAASILRSVAIFKRRNTPYGVADFGEFGPIRITRSDPDVIDLLRPFQRVMVA